MSQQSANSYLNSLKQIMSTGVELDDISVSRIHTAAGVGRYETCKIWFENYKKEIGANPSIPEPEWYQNITVQITEQITHQAARSWKNIAEQIKETVDDGLRRAQEQLEEFRSQLAGAETVISQQKIDYRSLEVDLKTSEQEKSLLADEIRLLKEQVSALEKEQTRLTESNAVATALNKEMEGQLSTLTSQHQTKLEMLTKQHQEQIAVNSSEHEEAVALLKTELAELNKQHTATTKHLSESQACVLQEKEKVIALQAICDEVVRYKSENATLSHKAEQYEGQVLMLTTQIGELSNKQNLNMERLILAGNAEAEAKKEVGILTAKLEMLTKKDSPTE